jgi:aldehyde dehydrogenase (NAD+)
MLLKARHSKSSTHRKFSRLQRDPGSPDRPHLLFLPHPHTVLTAGYRNGKVICSVQEATEKDVDIAVDAARKAYDDYHGAWRSMAPGARGGLLYKLGELFYREIDTLAAVEALDNGKAFSMAKGDVAASAECLKYYGGWSDKIHGKVIDTDDYSFRYTRHESVGVCGQIIPWNFPLLMWAWKIGPAVATGNTVVLKTAEQTPLSALVAAKLIVEAGFPPGVINIISGFGKTAGAAVASHMSVDKVAFTGSTVTGRSIMKASASSNLKKVTLELGGKSPTIIFDDADLDSAIDWANFGIYFNHGTNSRFSTESDTYSRTMLLRWLPNLRTRRNLR